MREGGEGQRERQGEWPVFKPDYAKRTRRLGDRRLSQRWTQQPRHACDGTRISSSRHRKDSACSRCEGEAGLLAAETTRGRVRAAGRSQTPRRSYRETRIMSLEDRRMQTPHGLRKQRGGNMSCRNGPGLRGNLLMPLDPCHPSQVQIPRPSKKRRKKQ